ncbi:MAG TPA: dynamin family protein [Stellaceae bacterium]|nr:dynamin family protein [Stellaceae bacterium]
MDLREYEEVKFALAALLRSAAALDPCDPQGRQVHEEPFHRLFSRLAEDRFNLVVVGRFSRGKTSLMNALLATDRLPTGIRPLTSVITTVVYGSEEKATIHYRSFSLPEDITLSALPQYITEEGNSANWRGVEIAEVRLPVELLRRGFHFVDTPGLGSPIVENTRTTERFLPEADAFVLVTGYDAPLAEDELRFLIGPARSARRVFVVVNKQDTVGPAQRAKTLAYFRQKLPAATPVFSVSARDGLAAKQAQDPALLRDSGVAAFEAALIRFLIDDKTREFLLGMCRRVADLVSLLPRSAATTRLDDELAALAGRIAAGRAETSEARRPAKAATAPAEMPAIGRIRPCEVCVLVARQSYDLLSHYQYDIIVSPERQRELAERGGLCSFHLWTYERLASPHGICAGFAAVLDRVSQLLSDATPGCGLDDLVPEPACIACEARAAAEAAAVAEIAARLRQNPEGVLRSLSDFCIPHFRMLAATIADHGIAARLLAREAALLHRVAEDMRRYALKHEGVRRDLASEEETQAARRALLLLGGHRTLNTPAAVRARVAS